MLGVGRLMNTLGNILETTDNTIAEIGVGVQGGARMFSEAIERAEEQQKLEYMAEDAKNNVDYDELDKWEALNLKRRTNRRRKAA